MQSVSTQFTQRAKGQVRPISWGLTMAFEKQFDEDVTFFTIGQSLIGGMDVIRPTGSDVVQQWDKYEYTDYSDRVVSVEWQYAEESFSSVTMPMADVTLNNYDDFFSPGSGSAISDYILPYRPLKIFAGFGGENVPVFVGLTEKMPEIDQAAKTVTFHCIGFLYSLYNRPLEESVMYVNMRTDQVLTELFELAGILSSQLNLDPGFNFIPFAYFEKGSTLGDAIGKLMEAEMGRLYMDEYGVITFKNRQNVPTTSTYTFGPDEIIDISTPKQDDIINVVEVTSNVRQVKEPQLIWEMTGPLLVPRGGTVELWAEFDDPVVSVVEPENYYGSNNLSWFEVLTDEDRSVGAVVEAGVTTVSFDVFATSAKMVFVNDATTDLWITQLRLVGEPAKVVKQIYVRHQDDVSVERYDERPLSIENDFMTSEGGAASKALIILDDYAEYGDIRVLTVKGSPAIQMGDMVTVDLPWINKEFIVANKEEGIDNKYNQKLLVKQHIRRSYFTVGSSLIGGGDVIAP